MQSLCKLQGHEDFIVREVMPRVSAISLPVFAVLGVLYNLLAVTVKLPVMLARYTVGTIPNSLLHKVNLSGKKEGVLADSMLEGTDVVSMTRQFVAAALGSVTGLVLTPIVLVSPTVTVKIAKGIGLYITDVKKELIPLPQNPPVPEVFSSTGADAAEKPEGGTSTGQNKATSYLDALGVFAQVQPPRVADDKKKQDEESLLALLRKLD